MKFRPILFPLLLAALLAPSLPAPQAAEPEPFPFRTDVSVDDWMLLGPVEESEAEIAEARLPEAFGSPAAPAIDMGRFLWHNDQPLRWFRAKPDMGGRLRVRQTIGPAERGGVVYAARRVECDAAREVVLALSGEGQMQAWLNGKALWENRIAPPEPNKEESDSDGTPQAAETPPSAFWSPPGDDCRLKILTLEPGLNYLVVKSVAPAPTGPWTLRARFYDRASFRKGIVVYPR